MTAERLLHGYFRSSAAYRVRIALNLKGLDYRHVSVHLLRDGGQQLSEAFRKLNPQAQVPVLEDHGATLTQSLAIIEYLEERYPSAPLLPTDLILRARIRQIALMVACDIHPLNNLRVLKQLAMRFGIDEAAKQQWMRHWIVLGFNALETELNAEWQVQRKVDFFCVGNSPTLADCCLIPQVFNALRFGIDMAAFPAIERIAHTCNALPAFKRAHPSHQPDTE